MFPMNIKRLFFSLRKAAKKHILKRRLNAQSAMEYLMTYGWAILIIAVVLAVLFSLGITNPLFFAPKAQPGSCQVLRPYGIGTSADMNLEGICNNEMPNFVAQFNGKNSYVELADVPQTGGPFTITAWGNEYNSSDPRDDIVSAMGAFFNLQSGKACLWVINSNGYLCSQQTLWSGQWAFVSAVFVPGSPGSETVYVDGKEGNSITKGMGGPGGVYYGTIGVCGYCGSGYGSFNGEISNVQFYNASLNSVEIAALYNEGIGGEPMQINNLIDWWPLNGNANDYSGNNNDGTSTNVIYTSTWTSGYAQP